MYPYVGREDHAFTLQLPENPESRPTAASSRGVKIVAQTQATFRKVVSAARNGHSQCPFAQWSTDGDWGIPSGKDLLERMD